MSDIPHALLVDDDELNRFVGQELLQGVGVRVTLAASGKEALQRLQREVFDIVFMDVRMPELNGYETTRQIRSYAHLARLPVIALTAHAFASERAQCMEAGMSDHLGKPFTLDELRRVIGRWCTPGSSQSPQHPVSAS